MSFAKQYLQEAKVILDKIPAEDVENLVRLVAKVRDEGGRIFFLGVGGSAANASHAVNDFRKICGIECYTPIDNVSELTARVNDDGWDTVFVNWLKGSSLSKQDMIFVFSVGGGNLEKNVSANIVKSLQYAKEVKARIGGIVGRDGGYTVRVADACIVIPIVNPDLITPHTEGFQGIVWHLVASHPLLHKNPTKWESIK